MNKLIVILASLPLSLHAFPGWLNAPSRNNPNDHHTNAPVSQPTFSWPTSSSTPSSTLTVVTSPSSTSTVTPVVSPSATFTTYASATPITPPPTPTTPLPSATPITPLPTATGTTPPWATSTPTATSTVTPFVTTTAGPVWSSTPTTVPTPSFSVVNTTGSPLSVNIDGVFLGTCAANSVFPCTPSNPGALHTVQLTLMDSSFTWSQTPIPSNLQTQTFYAYGKVTISTTPLSTSKVCKGVSL